MGLVLLGTIVRTHGVKGAFVVSTDAGKDSSLGKLDEITIEGSPYTVQEAAWMPSGWKIAVKEINTMEAAQALRGKEVFVKRSQLPTLGENEYYLDDLEGCEAFDEATEKKIGCFKSIETLNGGDVWRFEIEGESLLVIPSKRYIAKVEPKRKIFLRHLSELKGK